MEKKEIFKQVKKDIQADLLEQLKNQFSTNDIDKLGIISGHNKISDIGERLNHMDETSVKYLMKLTNNYIQAKSKSDESTIEKIADIFSKYGFDVHTLDNKINALGNKYNSNNEVWPSKTQEEIMQMVYSYFECPGKLPTVDEILSNVSKFGVMPENNWIDTRHFDDPYNISGYFETALNNGLSAEQILDSRLKIEKMMEYYTAPRDYFIFKQYPHDITSIVPVLDKDLEEMAMRRGISTLTVINTRLQQEIKYNNSQINDGETHLHK